MKGIDLLACLISSQIWFLMNLGWWMVRLSKMRKYDRVAKMK